MTEEDGDEDSHEYVDDKGDGDNEDVTQEARCDEDEGNEGDNDEIGDNNIGDD